MLHVKRAVAYLISSIWMLAAGLLPMQAAEGDKVTGTFSVDGKTTPLKYVYARTEGGSFDKTKQQVVVLITDQAVPVDALEDDFEVIHLANEGKVHGLALTINQEKQVISGQLFHEAFNSNVSATGMHVFKGTIISTESVEGRLYVSGSQETFDHHWQYDATFRVSLKKPAPTGTPLPAGGGEPGKTYLAYCNAIQRGDLEALKKLISQENLKDLEGPDAKKMLEMVRAMTPTRIKIVGGMLDGNKATLRVEGEMDGAKNSGTVQMNLEGTRWRLTKEKWKM